MLYTVIAAGLSLSLAAPAIAQTCNSMTGGVNCGASARGSALAPSYADPGKPESYRTFQSLGKELSFAGEQPATIGSITFSGGRRECSGLFRTTRC